MSNNVSYITLFKATSALRERLYYESLKQKSIKMAAAFDYIVRILAYFVYCRSNGICNNQYFL